MTGYRLHSLGDAEVIFLDQTIGDVDDIGGRAIVFPELIDHGSGECIAEAKDILYHSATEGVNTLRIISYDGEDRIRSLQLLNDLILHPIGILILVNEDISKSPMKLVPHLRMLPQQPEHIDEKVIEVHRIGPEAAAQIALVDVLKAGHPT